MRLLYQLDVILQHKLMIHWLILFYDNDSQLVFNLDYQLTRKELAFMVTKTLIIRCYTIKCDLNLYSLQHNIMHNIFDLTHNSHFQSNFKRTTNIIVQS